MEITSIQVLRILNAQLNEVKFRLKLSHLEYETHRHSADLFSLLIEEIIKLQISLLPKRDLCSLTLHVDALSFCYTFFSHLSGYGIDMFSFVYGAHLILFFTHNYNGFYT